MSAPLFGYVAIDPSRIDDDYPMDAATLKAIHNNAVHLWEYSGQVRVKTIDTAGIGPSTCLDSAWYTLLRVGFPCSMLPTRAPFNFRIRLAGKSGHATATTTYRVAVGHGAVTPWRILAGDNTLSATTTSTTLSWLIEDTIEPTVTDGENSMRSMATVVEYSLTKGTTVRVPFLFLEVAGKTSNSTYPPKLYGISAEEWPGGTNYFADGGFDGGGGGVDGGSL